MNRSSHPLLFLVLLSCFIGCDNAQKVIISEFDRPVVLEARSHNDRIARLRLKLKSGLTQPIKMTMMSEDRVVDEFILEAGAEELRLLDWYSDRAEIVLGNVENKNGYIDIEYEFLDV